MNKFFILRFSVKQSLYAKLNLTIINLNIKNEKFTIGNCFDFKL